VLAGRLAEVTEPLSLRYSGEILAIPLLSNETQMKYIITSFWSVWFTMFSVGLYNHFNSSYWFFLFLPTLPLALLMTGVLCGINE
jgi:hypothetical protein